jgi:hypothetical protein
MGLIKKFQDISFHHIYKARNNEADFLSKKSFMEPEGRITFYNVENGIEGHREHIYLF